jgi:hypothetical protein
MTSEIDDRGKLSSRVPLIARYGIVVPPASDEVLRYDSDRQIPQVFVRGVWKDRLEVRGNEGTLVTCVQVETTDDR